MEENIISAAEARPERGQAGDWAIDAAEIMQGIADGEDAAVPAAAPDAGGDEITLKHLDSTCTVTREKAVELAQKGMDYDRVRAKLESARSELEELRGWLKSVSGGRDEREFRDELSARALAEREGLEEADAIERVRLERERRGDSDQSPALRREREVREFVRAHPDIAAKLLGGEAIPDRVWQLVRAGESLNSAYERYAAQAEAEANCERIRALESELAETRLAGKNAGRSTGSAASDGGDTGTDPAAIGWGSV